MTARRNGRRRRRRREHEGGTLGKKRMRMSKPWAMRSSMSLSRYGLESNKRVQGTFFTHTHVQYEEFARKVLRKGKREKEKAKYERKVLWEKKEKKEKEKAREKRRERAPEREDARRTRLALIEERMGAAKRAEYMYSLSL
jgi:hypothetical protein